MWELLKKLMESVEYEKNYEWLSKTVYVKISWDFNSIYVNFQSPHIQRASLRGHTKAWLWVKWRNSMIGLLVWVQVFTSDWFKFLFFLRTINKVKYLRKINKGDNNLIYKSIFGLQELK